jgi:hypothetical protein
VSETNTSCPSPKPQPHEHKSFSTTLLQAVSTPTLSPIEPDKRSDYIPYTTEPQPLTPTNRTSPRRPPHRLAPHPPRLVPKRNLRTIPRRNPQFDQADLLAHARRRRRRRWQQPSRPADAAPILRILRDHADGVERGPTARRRGRRLSGCHAGVVGEREFGTVGGVADFAGWGVGGWVDVGGGGRGGWR